MSDFSKKCKEYMKLSGMTTYRLAAASGLNRTSLQRMLTGKRLPELSFVLHFCECIRINPSEKEELLKLYEIEKLGKEVYENRCYIQKFLEYIGNAEFLSSEGFCLPSSKHDSPLSFYRGTFSFYVEKQLYAYLEDLLSSDAHKHISLNLPPENQLLLHTLTGLYSIYKDLPAITHLFPLYRASEDLSASTENLNAFLCTLIFTLSGAKNYAPYYYYSNAAQNTQTFELFPYYVISDQKLLLISSDFSTCLTISSPKVIAAYQKDFQRLLQSASPLFLLEQSPEILIHMFSDVTGKKMPRYSLEPHPCISLLAHNQDILSALYPPPPIKNAAQAEQGTALDILSILEAFLDFYQPLLLPETDFHGFFTYRGLLEFAETGKLSGPYSWNQTPLSPEKRRQVLQHLLDTKLANGKVIMLKESFLPSIKIHLESFPDDSLFLLCLTADQSFLCIYLQESGIGHTIVDYLSSLTEERACYTTEESMEILKRYLPSEE